MSAFERAVLHGLPIYHAAAREFRQAGPGARARVVYSRRAGRGRVRHQAPFFAHNRKLLADIEQLEHKSRRQDVLVDDELIYAFYDRSAEGHLHGRGVRALVSRRREEERPAGRQARLLFLSRDDLMRHEAAGITTDLFPKRMTMAGIEMALTYHFEPGSPRDGVTLDRAAVRPEPGRCAPLRVARAAAC